MLEDDEDPLGQTIVIEVKKDSDSDFFSNVIVVERHPDPDSKDFNDYERPPLPDTDELFELLGVTPKKPKRNGSQADGSKSEGENPSVINSEDPIDSKKSD